MLFFSFNIFNIFNISFKFLRYWKLVNLLTFVYNIKCYKNDLIYWHLAILISLYLTVKLLPTWTCLSLTCPNPTTSEYNFQFSIHFQSSIKYKYKYYTHTNHHLMPKIPIQSCSIYIFMDWTYYKNAIMTSTLIINSS